MSKPALPPESPKQIGFSVVGRSRESRSGLRVVGLAVRITRRRGRLRVTSHRFVVPRYLCFTSNHSQPKSAFSRPATVKFIAKVSLVGRALAWGLDPRCSGRRLFLYRGFKFVLLFWSTVIAQRFGIANMKCNAHLNLQYKTRSKPPS